MIYRIAAHPYFVRDKKTDELARFHGRVVHQSLRVFGGLNRHAAILRVNLGQFRSEKQDLCGVIDPQHKYHETVGGPVGGGYVAQTQIEADKVVSQDEQCRANRRTNPDAALGDPRVGKKPEDYSNS
jgi:hypothetical protein